MTESERNYKRWIEYQNLDQEIRKELLSISSKEDLEDRFYKNLEFGTGGLRGILGAGTNRMNLYTVRKASQGFADYINENFYKNVSDETEIVPSVAISYDSRIQSDLFAMEAARVLMGNRIKVYLYPQLMPTPALSFAVRYYKCNAGIMVTASHNPAKYNGYKVYNEEGCQMTLDAAASVLNKIEQLDIFHDIKMVDYNVKADIDNYNQDKSKTIEEKGSSLLEIIPEEVTEAFLGAVMKESMGALGCENLSVVYTPLNGTGNLPVRNILSKIGVKNVTVVKEQELPDGNFPTCPYPNPEKEEALALGLSLCRELGDHSPDLLLATDPDCDRVGIAVRHQEKNLKGDNFRLLSGNQVGVLLLDFICQRRMSNDPGIKKMPQNPIAIKTIVSSKMIDAIASDYDVTVINVLTGFKFIGEQIGILERKGEENRYIFGYEESYGYLSGTYVRDKDAVNASMLICEMVSYYKMQGKTLIDGMEELYEKYGYFKEDLLDFTFEGSVGMEQMKNILNSLRQAPLTEIIGKRVVEISDYLRSQCSIFHEINEDLISECKPVNLPKSDVLEYLLEDGSSFMIRPSGTEPKLKIYLSAKGDTLLESEEIIKKLKEEMERIVIK